MILEGKKGRQTWGLGRSSACHCGCGTVVREKVKSQRFPGASLGSGALCRIQ